MFAIGVQRSFATIAKIASELVKQFKQFIVYIFYSNQIMFQELIKFICRIFLLNAELQGSPRASCKYNILLLMEERVAGSRSRSDWLYSHGV